MLAYIKEGHVEVNPNHDPNYAGLLAPAQQPAAVTTPPTTTAAAATQN